MRRREFVALGTSVVAAHGLGSSLVSAQAPSSVTIQLAIVDHRVETIDGVSVKVLAFETVGTTAGPRVPGPVLRVREGSSVRIVVRNLRPESHGFVIGGIASSRMTVPAGATREVTFTAPQAGTYLYHDDSHVSRHLYRLLGLHGAFVVHPLNGTTAANSVTPYSLDKVAAVDPDAAVSISALFDAFGTHSRFPGGKWVPARLDQEYRHQEKVWLFSEIDPKFNRLIKATGIDQPAMVASPAALRLSWVPRYFTINGRSGYDLAHEEDVVVKNYIGEPTLLRTICAGLCHHATHIHGNHLFELAHSVLTEDGFVPATGNAPRTTQPGDVIVHSSIWERDVWPSWPMQIRDMLLPMEVPPDIPDWDRFVNGTSQEPFPLRFVMHDHCEMGTTAGGGNYPQGAVTHWEIHGPYQGVRA